MFNKTSTLYIKLIYCCCTAAFILPANLFAAKSTDKHISASKEQVLNGNGLCFTPNKGQIADMDGKLRPDVLYRGDGDGADIYLRKTGISYVYSNMGIISNQVNEEIEQLVMAGIITHDSEQERKQELLQKQKIKIHRIDMDFEGCNSNISTTNENEVDGYQNFYYAHCPQGITNVKQYNKVTYKNIYNNIDISYYGDKQNGIKYDLIVQPHADPNQIKLHWTGAEELVIKDGKLIIKTSVNEFTESIPKVYQIIDGTVIDVPTRYILTRLSAGEAIINFSFSIFNSSFPLVVDPWATYYGGNDIDVGTGIATDNAGNVVITGGTKSGNFPVGAGYQTVSGGDYDAFVVKFSSTGIRLWATFYGSSNVDLGNGIATDNAGNVIITGYTWASNFPVGAVPGNVVQQAVFGGGSTDAFIIKFNPVGARLWGTFYGGSGDESGMGIATDNSGNVFITGNTSSANLPILVGGYTQPYGGGNDAFIIKFNSTGTTQWSAFYGGNDNDYGKGIATDIAGNVAITGNTKSGNFPVGAVTGNVVQQALLGTGAAQNAFVVKFNPGGARLWASFYGGTVLDDAQGIAIDIPGNVIITGNTRSADFPVGASSGNVVQQAVNAGSGDTYIVKFNPTGMRLWATFYGSWNTPELSTDVATDVNNNIYLLMEPEDIITPFLVDACTWQPVFNGGSSTNIPGNHASVEDQIIAKFSPTGQKICATYMGGTGEDDMDNGGGIAVFGNSIYITGMTDGGYPVTAGAFQTAYGGNPFDAFVASLCTNICEGKTLIINPSANSVTCPNVPVAFSPEVNNSCDTTGYKYKWTFSGGTPNTSTLAKPNVSYSVPGYYNVKLVVTTPCKKDSVTKFNYVIVNPCIINATVTGATLCSSTGCTTVTASGSDGTAPYAYNWNTGGTTSSISVCPPVGTTTYTVTITDANGNYAASTAAVTVKRPPVIVTAGGINIVCNQYGYIRVDSVNGLPSSKGASGQIPFPYQFNWSNNSQSYAQFGLAPGGYTVTVTDTNNGCSITKAFNITSTNPTSATFTFGTACVGSPVNFINTGTTGAGTTQTWTIGAPVNVSGTTTNFYYTFLTAGTYSITHVVANGGCNTTVTSNVTVINCNGPTVTTTSGSVCPGSCATLTSTGLGGTSPYTYSWSTGETIQNINPCPPITTTYTVTIKDTGGNTSTSTAVVTVNPAVTLTTAGTNTTCNGAINGSALANAGSGTPGYIYSWSAGVPGTGFQVSGLSAGNYTVTVTDSKGCSATSIVAINSPSPLIGQFTKGTANCTGCGCKEWIMVNATGGTNPYSYSWSASGGIVNRYRNQLCPGAYTINVKDKNGCSVNVNLTAP